MLILAVPGELHDPLIEQLVGGLEVDVLRRD